MYRVLSRARRLRQDEDGIVLIFVTLMMPVIIGLSLLAFDATRVYILHSSLQKGADAIAVAMAAELDRGTDAITRAQRARDTLLSNPAVFTSSYGAVNASSVTLRYLRSLPATDDVAIASADVTTDPTLARFVEVTVSPAKYDTIFPASFINALSSVSARASAIAGLEAGACAVTPMFICNPLEPAGNTDPFRITELRAHLETVASRRRLFELVRGPTSSSARFVPGNFGYLQTPLGRGARSLGDAISQVNPGVCIALNNLATSPGTTTVAAAAFNTRFDMYSGTFSRSDSEIRPALNTRKTWTPATSGNNRDCRPVEVTNLYTRTPPYSTSSPPASMGFPRDRCQVLSTCGSATSGRVGGGDWNGMFDLYMATNFPGSSRRPSGGASPPWSSTNLPSRFEVYRAEISEGLVNTRSMASPACYNGSVSPSNSPDRRSLYVAITNCVAQPIVGSGSTRVTAAAIGQFFLTEPVGASGSLFGELTAIRAPGVGGGSDGVLVVDNVQLYR